ncbi:hypothetical protein EG850_06215 [Gulosibacter macacae]|uniref:Septum formation-related domain-containing protein n=1 Tax=Gulosibacter macacae TaxID=2488791 RepID=A0A3P3VX11_9MICO|nr:septum formation family protein [Gulosibacter macacae]RRJ86994.1 hypothetical protein EG850_06215 [Gulosibacter macacae]
MSERDASPTSRRTLREEQRPRSRWLWPIALTAVVLVAAGVVGWQWAPFGLAPADRTPVPTVTEDAVTPVAALAAGTCLAEFSSPWDATFVPIDCAQPHVAEQYAVVPVASQFSGEVWPGVDALSDRAMLACQAADALNLDAAGQVAGLMIEARWPSSQAEWDAGVRDYRCFAVTLGSDLVGSLAAG